MNSDLKTVLDFMLDYGEKGDLPNMDEGGSGEVAYAAAQRVAHFTDLYAWMDWIPNRRILTSEDLGKSVSHEISEAIWDTLLNQGIRPLAYGWSVVVDIDGYEDEQEPAS